MQIYTVGKRFPDFKQAQEDAASLSANNGFVDIICQLTSPNAKEIQAFKNGMLTIAVYVQEYIPFLIIKLHDINLEMDASYNASIAAKPGSMWRMSDASNVCNLFLVERVTGELKAMRMLGINKDLVALFKKSSIEQVDERKFSKEQFDTTLNSIYSSITLKEMYSKSVQQTFTR